MNAVKPADAISAVTRQNLVYRSMVHTCDQLADAALNGADPAALTTVFAGLVHKRVVLLDAEFELRSEASGAPAAVVPKWDRADLGVERLLRALAAERRTIRVPSVPDSLLRHGCLATPIAVGQETLGYLLLLDEPDSDHPDDSDLLIVTYAATLFALTLAHEKTSTELGLRYQRAIVDGLLSGHFLDAEDARRKAAALGLAECQSFRVGVLRAVGADSLAASTRLIDELTGSLPGVVTAARGAGVALLLAEDDAASSGRRLLAEFLAQHRDAPLTCGLSESLRRAEQAPQGFRQAEQAIDLGIRLGRSGKLVCYDELGIYRLLLLVGEMRELWQFAADVLGPLLEYEAAHRVDLVGTLSAYLAQHGSLKQTARVLRVHANTVAYRTQRIEQLTRLDLSDPDDRLLAHVAIKIIESQRGDDSTLG